MSTSTASDPHTVTASATTAGAEPYVDASADVTSAVTDVSSAVAAVLAERTSEVFVLMGNGNAHLTDALARDPSVTLTAVRHEAATVASADAFHRVSRRIAVATTTYGPGFTNTLTPLADAAMARTPLVYVVGGQPTTGPRPWDVDQRAMAEAAGALTLALDATTPRALTRRAFDLALEHRRPVVLFLPFDLATAEAGDEAVLEESSGAVPAVRPCSPAGQDPDAAVLDHVATVLENARFPLVLAGRGARHAAHALGALADGIGALTASSAPARGTFAGRAWDLGVCGGFASEASSALIRRADVILVVGAGLNQFTRAFGDQFAPAATIIQVDVADAATHDSVDLFLRGDAAEVVPALLERVRSRRDPVRAGAGVASAEDEDVRWEGTAEAARSSRTTFDRPAGAGLTADGRLDPRSAMIRLDELLPRDRQVVSDGGHFIGWANYYLDLPRPDSLVMVGTHFQSIGLGFPSAAGAVRARPDVMTVLVTGDGGGLMGLPDLDTLVRTAASALVVVFNDACYGAEIHQYGSQGLDTRVMEIAQTDFATLATGFGARGLVVESVADLDAVASWVAEGAHGTLLLDMRVSNTVVAPYIEEIRAKTLKKA